MKRIGLVAVSICATVLASIPSDALAWSKITTNPGVGSITRYTGYATNTASGLFPQIGDAAVHYVTSGVDPVVPFGSTVEVPHAVTLCTGNMLSCSSYTVFWVRDTGPGDPRSGNGWVDLYMGESSWSGPALATNKANFDRVYPYGMDVWYDNYFSAAR
jgi:3D (Asp-Asp-Asp) domain-containing protein